MDFLFTLLTDITFNNFASINQLRICYHLVDFSFVIPCIDSRIMSLESGVKHLNERPIKHYKVQNKNFRFPGMSHRLQVQLFYAGEKGVARCRKIHKEQEN